MRLSLLAAVGALLVSLAAPSAAFAAPTLTPTVGPQRAPAMSLSPSPAASPAAVAASPAPVAAPATPPLPLGEAARSAGEGCIRPSIVCSDTHPSPLDKASPRGRGSQGTPQPTLTATPTPTPDDANNGQESDSDSTDAEVDWRAFVPTDTADHLATMDRAARQSGCGVPWQLLAAIARVESDFGRNMATSSAGAIGYGQFLPSSWQAFGSDGNAYDYRDALPAIAQYLCRAGLARDPRRALFAYNHADWYVDLVLDLAVRYDRMAPGAPVPEVLSVGPAAEPVHPLHYAVATPTPLWLTVPWRGRKAGAPISPASLAI